MAATEYVIKDCAMIIISNGHHKFITGPAAVEAYKNNLLVGFITAGYPTPVVRKLISWFRLDRYASIARLLQQQESELPDNFVHTNWLSEIIYRVTNRILAQFPRMENIADYGLRFYAWQAEHIIRRLSGRIYHYRGGYGRNSVRIAQKKGMVALCDFSTVHPKAINYLISHGGKLPPIGQSGHMNSIWNNILKDADQADFLLVNSDFVKTTFTHFGYAPDRIFVLYTGVDDRFLSLIPQRTYQSFGNRPIRLLFAGDMGARKGGKVLLEALSRIRDLQWEFEAIGSIDSDLRNEFSNFFDDERVTVTGNLLWPALAEHMSRADVFVFPSLAEGSARVVFMAMACGCYVITTPNSGSIVQDGVNGRVISPGDVDELEAALRNSFLERDAIPLVGRVNADLIKSDYTQSHYGKGLLEIYQQILEN